MLESLFFSHLFLYTINWSYLSNQSYIFPVCPALNTHILIIALSNFEFPGLKINCHQNIEIMQIEYNVTDIYSLCLSVYDKTGAGPKEIKKQSNKIYYIMLFQCFVSVIMYLKILS